MEKVRIGMTDSTFFYEVNYSSYYKKGRGQINKSIFETCVYCFVIVSRVCHFLVFINIF